MFPGASAFTKQRNGKAGTKPASECCESPELNCGARFHSDNGCRNGSRCRRGCGVEHATGIASGAAGGKARIDLLRILQVRSVDEVDQVVASSRYEEVLVVETERSRNWGGDCAHAGEGDVVQRT